jgi:spore maturation protein CgeB
VDHSFASTGSIRILKLMRYASHVVPSLEDWMLRALVRRAEVVKPDLILNIVGDVPPDVVRRVKEVSRGVIVLWYPDSVVNLGRGYALAADYDVYFFHDRYMVECFRDKLGKRAFLLPGACNPLWHRKVELSDEEKRFYGCDLTLAGNMYYYRALILERFMEFECKIWGVTYPRWLKSPVRRLYQNRYVAELEKAKAFNAAKIVLNVMHYGEIMGVNDRCFEAAGCGAFQIVDWKPNIAEFFEPEKEVVTFRTLGELKEKVRYYLEHEKERKEIADRAYERAHREHTYEKRLKRLLELAFGASSDEG